MALCGWARERAALQVVATCSPAGPVETAEIQDRKVTRSVNAVSVMTSKSRVMS